MLRKYFLGYRDLREGLALYTYLQPYRLIFIAGLACLLITTCLLLYIPICVQQLVDISVHSSLSNQALKKTGLFTGCLILLQAFFSFFRILIFEEIGNRVLADIRKEVFKKIITQPVPFFELNQSGALNSRLLSDVNELQDALSRNLAQLIQQFLLPLLCLPLLYRLAPGLTINILVFFPVLLVCLELFSRKIKILARKAQDAVAETSSIAEEAFQAWDIIKVFTSEIFEQKRFSGAIDKALQIALRASRYKAIFIGLLIVLMAGSCLWIIVQGLNEVEAGRMTIGALISFILFLLFIGTAISGFIESYASIHRAVGASSRIREILKSAPEVDLADIKKITVKGDIQFRNAHFSYPSRPEIKILSDLNFSVSSGQKIAIVGKSGSGKSTLIKLLCGFYSLDAGEILIDGKSIEGYDLRAFRENIGIVPQDVFIFNDTVKMNLQYGSPDATKYEIIDAARQAHAWEFIERFSNGLDTRVGPKGIRLSGGQKQRLAIARAILRKPRILILDEATSSLDSQSEVLVKEALEVLMKGRTSFIIAHRFSTIQSADLILVIDGGQIIAQGTHNELKQRKGLYADLLWHQFGIN